MDDRGDFFVDALAHSGAIGSDWMVCRGKPASTSCRCVGVYADSETATAAAIRMAQYHAAIGEPAQVHAQGDAPGMWQTVWCPAGAMPRYPGKGSAD